MMTIDNHNHYNIGNHCSIYGFYSLGRKCLMACASEAFTYYVKTQGDLINFLHHYILIILLSVLLISENVIAFQQ